MSEEAYQSREKRKKAEKTKKNKQRSIGIPKKGSLL